MRVEATIIEELGGKLFVSSRTLGGKFYATNVLLFDWDGVFNGGRKGENVPSDFAELDSMGLNLMRYTLWRHQGKMPLTGIITGRDNAVAKEFAVREHLDFVFSSFLDKSTALDYILPNYKVRKENIMYVFDDVLDLSLAREVGLRIMVGNNSTRALQSFAHNNDMCDYITANYGDRYAIREVSEVLLTACEIYDDIVRDRMSYTPRYQQYFDERNALETKFYTPDSIVF